MDKKLTTLIGLSKDELDVFINKKEILLRHARLITTHKPGDEMALTSVLLSAMRLIKEFRKMIMSDLNMATGGQIFVYTEVNFPEYPDRRIDGLILIVRGGVIKDAALCEMKNGTDELDKQQIEAYQEVAKYYSIPRLITVSNQFVSEPTQFPIEIKRLKDVDLFHFSWSYLLTIAHVLLCDNDTNIEDEDQVEIMHEVVKYLEHPKSGVCGFNEMRKGWSEVVDKVNTGALLKSTDPDIYDTVLSWQQEEKDQALILSRWLGLLVETGKSKYKDNLKARLDDDSKQLIENKQLSSTLRVRGAVSDINILAHLDKRTVEISVTIQPPKDKKARGQIGWMRRQFDLCSKKNELIFAKIRGELLLEIWMKNLRMPERVAISQIDDIYECIGDREIKEVKVVYHKDFGKLFSSRRKFVEIIEQMNIDFYSGVIQYLVNWEPSAPRMGSSSQSSAEPNVVARPREQPIPDKPNEPAQPEKQSNMNSNEIPTAPCPLCQGPLILSTLQVGYNICPHCEGTFEAG